MILWTCIGETRVVSEEAEEGSLMMLRDEEELEWPDLEGEEMVTKIKMKD